MSKTKIAFLVILLAAAGAGVWVWQQKPFSEKSAPRPVARAVPVKVIMARVGDIPVFLSGIGNVAPLNAAIVRPQIDGELLSLHFSEGQKVEKGDLLAEIDSRSIRAELARAEAERNSNKAQLAIAKMDLQRYNILLREDAIARQIVDQQKATVQQLEAAIQVAQAAIDVIQVRLSFTKIMAPISGHVGIRRIDAGNIVSAADPAGLITITQTDPVAVFFSLPQTNLGDLLPLLQKQDRPVDIMPREDGQAIATGQLETIDNKIDNTTGTVRLKVIVDNDQTTLWPGQFVIARIKVRTYSDRIILPVIALQRGRDDIYVFRIKDKTAETVPVKILYENEEQAVVEGLEEGDLIVTDGQLRLKDGTTVSMASEDNNPPIAPSDEAIVTQ